MDAKCIRKPLGAPAAQTATGLDMPAALEDKNHVCSSSLGCCQLLDALSPMSYLLTHSMRPRGQLRRHNHHAMHGILVQQNACPHPTVAIACSVLMSDSTQVTIGRAQCWVRCAQSAAHVKFKTKILCAKSPHERALEYHEFLIVQHTSAWPW